MDLTKIYQKYHGQVQVIGQVEIPSIIPIHGHQVAPPFKCVTDQLNGLNIWYADAPHLYFLEYPNKMRMPMMSVTTAIHLFSRPFMKEQMSLRCAGKDSYEAKCLDKSNWYNISIEERQQRIMKAWEDNNLLATTYGTFAHAVMEYLTLFPEASVEEAYSTQLQALPTYEDYSYIKVVADNYRREILKPLHEDGWMVVAEPLIYNLNSFLAGQSDVVAIHHERKLIKILDFKTNVTKPGEEKSYGKMLGKLSRHDDVNLSHYSIQLCLYQLMVQSVFPGYSLDTNELLWIDRETYLIHPVAVEPYKWNAEVSYILDLFAGVRTEVFEYYNVEHYTQTKLKTA